MYKIFFSTVVVLFSVFSSQAQVSKGQFLLGGEILAGRSRIEATNTPERKITDFTFRPQIGYAFRDTRVLGLSLFYRTNNDNGTALPYNIHQAGAGLFYRSYLTLPKNFYIFGQAEVEYRYTKEEFDLGVPRTAIWTFNDYTASLHPGVGYAVKKRFHLELAVNELFSLTYRTSRKLDINQNITTEQKTTSWLLKSDIYPQRSLIFAFRFLLGGDSDSR